MCYKSHQVVKNECFMRGIVEDHLQTDYGRYFKVLVPPVSVTVCIVKNTWHVNLSKTWHGMACLTLVKVSPTRIFSLWSYFRVFR